uniref:Protein Wnt n=1 Tax=Clytia hemisphaerica TaxID=252671 RepID=B3FRM8_9CNID|nr:WntX2 [Clytia hemisphaerica]
MEAKSLLKEYFWSLGQIQVNNIPQHLLINSYRLTRQQKLIIETTPKLLESVSRGASLATQECRRQFQYRKWNCPIHTSQSVFGRILKKACRETAFIYAITSAGATYALTENCAKGLIKDCSCRQGNSIPQPKLLNPHLPPKQQELIYEGCHDNIQYGYHRGKAFVDATEGSRDFHAFVNLHNNEAGRQAVIDSMVIQCKCHGVSGNCNVKTCRKALPKFSEVGKRLITQYDTAAKVQAAQILSTRRIGKSARVLGDEISIPRSKSDIFRQPQKQDLIFIEDSPNFCVKNVEHGSMGTQGRYCNSSLRAKGTEGCDVLCCGRQFVKEKLTGPEKCNCKFIWCCEVTCEQCIVTREYSKCK